MVKDDLKRELGRLFMQGFEDSLTPGIDATQLEVSERSSLADDKDEFFLLTVSSQLFRQFILIHFSRDQITENFVSEAMSLGTNALTEDAFYDFLGEVGNAFCGYLKRELNKTVPHLGMSTPNRLSKECLPYMQAIKPDYTQHAVAEYQGQAVFYASTYLSADQDLPYQVNTQSSQEEETDSGELEFF